MSAARVVRRAPSSPAELDGLPTARALTPQAAQLATSYLQRILTSHVYEVARETPLDVADILSRRLGNTVLLKREDQQPVFSFKVRGAYNRMAKMDPASLARGVICASAGNHAQGVALAASRLGTTAVVVMPVTTPSLKVDAVRALGAEVVLHGDSYSEASALALALQHERGLTYVHPFDDPDVIAGQGTVAMEILRQQQGPIDAIFVAVGGGGLIAGVAAYIKALRPEIRVIGVQMADADAMLQSVRCGERVTLPEVGLFSDGTAVKQVGEETFRIARALVDDYVVVDTDAVCAAIKDVFEDTRSVLEPAGALGVAAIKQYAEAHRLQGRTLVAITCGANINFDRLRFVAERAEIGEQREALFAVTIPEAPGSVRQFCGLLGEHAVTELNYRISSTDEAQVFIGLAISCREQAARLCQHFHGHGLAMLDLTDNEFAKAHVRHMVGGRSASAHGERLFRFQFPERPGALLRFLEQLQPTWNVSLLQYRNQGMQFGRILMGIQIPPGDDALFETFLRTQPFPGVEETANPAAALFLGRA